MASVNQHTGGDGASTPGEHDWDGADDGITSETSRLVKVNHRFFGEHAPDTQWDWARVVALLQSFVNFS